MDASRMLLCVMISAIGVVIYCARQGSAQLITEERCSSETFQIRCSSPPTAGRDVTDHVIVVRRALYGRMRPARRCISAVYAESMGCRADVTAYMHAICTGRRNCTMLVATMDSVTQPCPKDFKSYLEITYECIDVSFIDDCSRSANSTVHLTKDRGFLALFPNPDQPPFFSADGTAPVSVQPLQHPASISGGGSTSSSNAGCSWLIEAPPGRTVDVLWKVSGSSGSSHDGRHLAGSASDGVDDSMSLNPCPLAIVFRDGDPHRPETVVQTACGRHQGRTINGFSTGQDVDDGDLEHEAATRQHELASVFYRSTSSRLEVHPAVADLVMSAGRPGEGGGTTGTDQWQPYILEYRFVGCEDLALAVDGALVTRVGDVTTIVCGDESRETWQVTCRDDVWSGETGNCSQTAAAGSKTSDSMKTPQTNVDIKTGVVVAVLIGIVLGVVVGSFMMLIVFIVKHRGQNRDYKSAATGSHALTINGQDASIESTRPIYCRSTEPCGGTILSTCDCASIPLPPSQRGDVTTATSLYGGQTASGYRRNDVIGRRHPAGAMLRFDSALLLPPSSGGDEQLTTGGESTYRRAASPSDILCGGPRGGTPGYRYQGARAGVGEEFTAAGCGQCMANHFSSIDLLRRDEDGVAQQQQQQPMGASNNLL